MTFLQLTYTYLKLLFKSKIMAVKTFVKCTVYETFPCQFTLCVGRQWKYEHSDKLVCTLNEAIFVTSINFASNKKAKGMKNM